MCLCSRTVWFYTAASLLFCLRDTTVLLLLTWYPTPGQHHLQNTSLKCKTKGANWMEGILSDIALKEKKRISVTTRTNCQEKHSVSVGNLSILHCNAKRYSKKWLKLKTFISELSRWVVLTFQVLPSLSSHFSFQIKPWQTHPHSVRQLNWSGTAYFSRASFQQNSPNQLCLRAIPITQGGESTLYLCLHSCAFPKADSNQLWGRGFLVVEMSCSKNILLFILQLQRVISSFFL